MKPRKTPVLLLAACFALLASTAGCNSTSSSRSSSTADSKKAVNAWDDMESEPAPRAGGWPSRRSDSTTSWSALAHPTGVAGTSVLGVEKGMPREVRLNDPFDYQLIVTNLTANTVKDVVVTEIPDDGLRLNSSNPAGRATSDGVIWALGNLGPRESKTIRVNATAAREGSVGSCAVATYDTALCATVPVVSPKLMLTKTGPAEVLRCDDIVYRLEVKNTGTGTVRDVKIVDALPAGLRAKDGGQTVTLNVGDLSAAQSKPFTIRAEATRAGTFENSATASGAGNLTATSDKVTTVVKQPALKITKTCPPKQFIGRAIEYGITVSNTGNGEARDTVITDTIPSGTAFASASDGGRTVGGKVRWEIGTLAPNASKTVRLVVNPSGAGSYRNTVSASAYCADAVNAECTTEVTGIPAILLEVIDVEDPVQVGTNETYVITVTNQGSAPDTNIRVVCTLEPNQEHVSNSGATRGTAAGNTVTFAPLASLGAGDEAVFRVVVRNVRAGDVRFKVTMTSDQLTRPVEETEATNIYE